ncbi:uncharacterized protein RCC_03304 [Ramularia collo-cygni]|uniref:Uncharacterized protein n=1 Tax=Ramularia collo-cygni TaxID=112498 RepID=A0A2D3UWH7_9PEZI|nr:uncharacterized protein RCC_03304 [Ramularia collo-cygni]CZT17470.1 uncharacterized protein RCC_03304 [Ramularia collo-cygni]
MIDCILSSTYRFSKTQRIEAKTPSPFETLFISVSFAATRRPNTDNDNDNDTPNATTKNAATATKTRTTKTNSSQTSCPTNQSSYSYNQKTYCCPGNFYGSGSDALCGISCSGNAAATSAIPSNLSCSSTIMITENSYQSKVAAATAGTATSSGVAAAIVTAGPMFGALVFAGGVLVAV